MGVMLRKKITELGLSLETKHIKKTFLCGSIVRMINGIQKNTPPRTYGACGNRLRLACSSHSPPFVPASAAASFVPHPPLSSSVSQPNEQNGAILLYAFYIHMEMFQC